MWRSRTVLNSILSVQWHYCHKYRELSSDISSPNFWRDFKSLAKQFLQHQFYKIDHHESSKLITFFQNFQRTMSRVLYVLISLMVISSMLTTSMASTEQLERAVQNCQPQFLEFLPERQVTCQDFHHWVLPDLKPIEQNLFQPFQAIKIFCLLFPEGKSYFWFL